MTARPDVHPVTMHAALRYVQRGIGIDLRVAPFLPEWFALQLHLYAADITRDEIDVAVMVPAVLQAIAMGIHHIPMPFGILCAKSGFITTILPPAARTSATRRKLSPRSKREHLKRVRRKRAHA